MKPTMRRLSFALLLGALALNQACGSTASEPPNYCKDTAGTLCNPRGVPFVQFALVATDACSGALCPSPPLSATTATLSQPESGKLCLSGTVATGGYVVLNLEFTKFNQDNSKVLAKFDAAARGITQVAFTLDSPPSAGLTLGAAITTSLDCPATPLDCFTYGFEFMTAPLSNVPVRFTEIGPQTAAFSCFEQTRSGVSQTFDTSALEFVSFNSVGPGDYDFCFHDFKLLNAAGAEVKP